MLDKLILPLHDPFECQPFWNQVPYVVFDEGVRDLLPPKPPQCCEVHKSELAGQGEKIQKNLFGSVRSKLGRLLRGEERLRECRRRLRILEWITGFRTGVKGRTYDDFIKAYQSFALNLLYILVGQLPIRMPYPDETLLLLYRARRVFVETEHDEDPLDFVRSYTTPFAAADQYSNLELHSILLKALEKKQFIITRLKFQAVFSNKATLEYDRAHGGFNATVGALSQYEGGPLALPVQAEFTGKSCALYEFGIRARRDKALFCGAVNASICIMRSIKRAPIAYVFIIPERSGKARVPTLPEGWCGILSRYVSSIGKEIQKRLFPITTRRSEIKMKHVPGSYYLSGDYKDSTSYLGWESAIVGWFHIFTQAGMSGDDLDLHMEIIKFLIGPHVFFSSSDERKRYQQIFSLESRVTPFPSKCGEKEPLTNVNERFLQSWVQFGPIDHAPVGIRDGRTRSGMCKVPLGGARGKVDVEYTHFPCLKEVMSGVLSFRLQSESITAVRGLIMAYSIAAPALHVVGAIPHWKFRGVEFIITGDDNASRHKSMESIYALEAEKRRTLMVPHDSKKSAVGQRGVLLAEELLVVPDDAIEGTPLVSVKNFPIRVLFPQFDTDWHAITMPAAAYSNLKEVSDLSVRERILGFIFWKYKPIYDKLEDLKVTPFGENGIFTDRRAPSGYLNSVGGYTAAQVFKRSPGVTQPAWTERSSQQLSCSVLDKVTIYADDGGRWDDHGMSRNYTDFQDLTHAVSGNQVVSPYHARPTVVGETDLLTQVRRNLQDLDYKRPLPKYKYCIGPEGETVRVPFWDEGLRFDHPAVIDVKHPTRDEWNEELFYEDESSPGAEKVLDSFCEDLNSLGLPGFSDGVRNGPRQLEYPLGHIPEEIRSNWMHSAAAFTDALPPGVDFRQLLRMPKQHFVDVANLKRGNYDPGATLHQLVNWYESRKYKEKRTGTLIWLVVETPGRPTYHIAAQNVYVLACPRRNGRAGADLEFRHILSLTKQYGPKVTFESKDADWARIYRRK